MIVVFQMNETFTYARNYDRLLEQCRKINQQYGTSAVEFFDTLQPSVPERFYIIRINTKEKDLFVSSMESFADAMEFTILNKEESRSVLKQYDIDKFC